LKRPGPLSTEELLARIELLEKQRDALAKDEGELHSQVEALNALGMLRTPLDIRANLPALLMRLMECKCALLLEEAEPGWMQTVATSDPKLLNHRWPIDRIFKRVLAGETISAFDVGMMPEWNSLDVKLRGDIRTAVHLALSGDGPPRIIVVADDSTEVFSPQRVETLERIVPSLRQVFQASQMDGFRVEAQRAGHAHRAAQDRVDFLETVSQSMGLALLDMKAGHLVNGNKSFKEILGANVDPEQWAERLVPLVRALQLNGKGTERPDAWLCWVQNSVGEFELFRIREAPTNPREHEEENVRAFIVERTSHELDHERSASSPLTLWHSNREGQVLAMTPEFRRLVRTHSGVDVNFAEAQQGDASRDKISMWERIHAEAISAGHLEKDIQLEMGGTTKTLRVRADVQSGGSGDGGVLGQIKNESWRHLGTDTLKDTKTILDAVVSTALDSIISIDQEGRVLEWNPAAEATFGFPREDAVGVSLGELIIPEQYREAHQRGMERYLSTGEHVVLGKRIELEALHSDGHTFPIEMSITPVLLEGRPIFTAYLRNIKNRVEAQGELEEARKKAEASNQAKTHFLGMVSHEIRTPMNLVIGLLELAQSSTTEKEQRDYVATARQNAQSLLSLFNDLLESIRLETTEFQLKEETFDIRPFLRQVLEGPAQTVESRPLHIILDVDPNVPDAVTTDSGRLRQVITNLLHNALKVTARGAIYLQAKALEVDGIRSLQISLTDSGPGFDQEPAKLFERFFHSTSEAMPIKAGVGLGLGISKTLVEKMGGAIDARNNIDGSGATFEFSLPTVFQEPRGSLPGIETASQLGHLSILTENSISGRILQSSLRHRGFVATWEKEASLLTSQESASRRLFLDIASAPGPDSLSSFESWPGIWTFGGPGSDLGFVIDVDEMVRGHADKTNSSADALASASSPMKSSPRSFRILVVEDNKENGPLIQKLLMTNSRTVDLVTLGNDAVEK
jgi:PAS domain S-box-containing protein